MGGYVGKAGFVQSPRARAKEDAEGTWGKPPQGGVLCNPKVVPQARQAHTILSRGCGQPNTEEAFAMARITIVLKPDAVSLLNTAYHSYSSLNPSLVEFTESIELQQQIHPPETEIITRDDWAQEIHDEAIEPHLRTKEGQVSLARLEKIQVKSFH